MCVSSISQDLTAHKRFCCLTEQSFGLFTLRTDNPIPQITEQGFQEVGSAEGQRSSSPADVPSAVANTNGVGKKWNVGGGTKTDGGSHTNNQVDV